MRPGCWEWQAFRHKGYGRFLLGGPTRAHRVAYEILNGPIPDGMVIDHLCRNKGCVNPTHLEAVSQWENMQRHYSLQTHCIRGHEFTPENNTAPRTTTSAGGDTSMPNLQEPTTHVVIPDTQVRPGVRTDHLGWIGRYILDHFKGANLKIIHLGDHFDMPSLSSYDKGKKQMEGRRYLADVAAGCEAIRLLLEPTERYNRKCRDTDHHGRQWNPEWHFLMGNHENRIERAVEADAQLEGLLSLDHLETPGWVRHPFLEVVDLDGVWYSHYFYQPMNGRPYTGTIENRLRMVGHSFTMGHQQTFLSGVRYVGDKRQRGLVAGSCYLHDEEFKGPQGNHHWRGVLVCHEVEDGEYDLMEVSLDFLCRKYEGVRLEEFLHEAGQ